ncbi:MULTISPECIES: aminopeptidase C [Pedobacter]|uniref:Aminopeptidase n=1 Tax=Pedobacter heparinus (strain ATCC 13125 / DSM 2366 / CIP 104194 / JCM 7457 / NBRC 12017 / NCIMB 9290 / NRRL B-14731 / HIM 762-3) TaxID=485917 RepID=C6XU28_PEDHD|nr:peptidase C1B bleomycin hydrolase [Pedobacter heparinus DSM 2366]MBB5440912.1 bleomycin hydrolase [Pedobacter sp. AK017]
MIKISMKPLWLAAGLLFGSTAGFAQDNLVNSLKNNQSANSANSFIFTPVINAEATSIKDQKSSGTCWSYSTNSFLESEMIRMGKKPVDLADLFTARNAYIEKGINYVRMHGALTLGDGGACHDVINMFAKYGALPQEVYNGNNYGSPGSSDRMNKLTEAILKKAVAGKFDPSWKAKYIATIDSCMGAVPEKFTYEGKEYTPKTFAKEVVGINPADYVELSSFTTSPYYEKTVLMVPDNWSYDQVYNVQMNDITSIIDNALKKGFTVAWATDVSEKGFSWKNGVAYVPEKDFDNMSADEKKTMFNGPKPEKEITVDMRQTAFDDYETTDDHGMQITGIAKDQAGKEYYIVKNSWGVSNDYKGYLYVTRNFVKYKTTAFLLHKNGIPSDLRKKMKI